MKIYSRFEMKNSMLYYLEDDNALGFVVIPKGKEICLNKECAVEHLVQLKLLEDDHDRRFTNGLTMRNSKSVQNLRFVCQETNGNEIVTTFNNPRGHIIKHFLTMSDDTLEVYTVFENQSNSTAKLEMISSFSLGCLTPFEADETTGNLVIHRLQSYWAAEGKLLSQKAEELHLEPNIKARNERFGSLGSMPVRR